MGYRLVLFDFDGTLADSFPWFLGVVNDLADRLRFRRVDLDDVDRLRGLGARRIIQHLRVSWWKLPLVARRLRQRMMADAGLIRPFPGVPEMLRRLSGAGVALGVVTSNTEHNVRVILGDSAALITHWECRASLFGKADRFRAVLRRTGLSPREAICVGDELRDADAARAAGIDFAAVAWGFSTREALVAAGPVLVFDRVDEVADRLLAAHPRAGITAGTSHP